MQDLTLSLIQTELAWEDIPANLSLFEAKIDAIAERTDVIILPEMFTTGFTMNVRQLAESMNGTTVSWMTAQAGKKQVHLVGSVIIEEDRKYFNRLIWVTPQGEIQTYDKKHLFRMAGEHQVFSAGNRHLTVTVNGWKLRPFICYDLRFPIWCRNIDNAYDAAIYIANWPAKRAPHWKLLLPARAVENQGYVIGVNRVGTDGQGLAYSGDSVVIDPLGNTVVSRADTPCTITTTLRYDTIQQYRKTFAAWLDADNDVDFPVDNFFSSLPAHY